MYIFEIEQCIIIFWLLVVFTIVTNKITNFKRLCLKQNNQLYVLNLSILECHKKCIFSFNKQILLFYTRCLHVELLCLLFETCGSHISVITCCIDWHRIIRWSTVCKVSVCGVSFHNTFTSCIRIPYHHFHSSQFENVFFRHFFTYPCRVPVSNLKLMKQLHTE